MKTFDLLGNTVSKLGFGAMRLPTKPDGSIDQEHFNKMVAYAIDKGVNYFDTSFVYHDGNSEVALGIALEPYERSSYLLADKMSFWSANSEEFLETSFQTSLKKLKTDYIDFYLLHSLNELTYSKAKAVHALEWAIQKKKEGKIRYLGFSIHADYDFLLDVLKDYDWDFVQIQLNYLDTDDNPGLKGYEELAKRGIPVQIMEPLKGGVLTDLPDTVTAPFAKLGGSNASFAFRWLAEKPGIGVILSGMSSMEQVEANTAIFDEIAPLNDEEKAAIDQVKQNILDSQKVGCTGCRYCMPCPVGIDIPGSFKAWNNKSMQKNSNWISSTAVDKNKIQQCVECGQCMNHCPQNIQIPVMLKQLLQEM